MEEPTCFFSSKNKRIGEANGDTSAWRNMRNAVLQRIPGEAIIFFYETVEKKILEQLTKEREFMMEYREEHRKKKKLQKPLSDIPNGYPIKDVVYYFLYVSCYG